jgi:hypothetical protein
MRVHRMTRDEDIARGDRAKHLLEDEDLRSGFLAVRSSCIENMSRSVGPDEAWVAVAHVQAVDRVWGALQAYWKHGESAMADLVAEQQQIRKTSDDTGAVRNRLEEAETARADWALRDQWKWERGQTS